VTLLGIDIGGTNARIAAVGDRGALLASRRVPTRGAGETLGALLELAETVLDGPPRAVGIGITGPVDAASGVVDNPHTLVGWPPTDVAAPFRERFGVPVAVDNDANAAALGEWWRGAGRGALRLAAITLGTGIGVGLLVGGRVQRGADGRHGEIGHHVLDPAGPECYCGARGCWESLAAGPALAHRAGGRDVARGVREGDPVALQAVAETARWIGLGLVNVGAFFMPDVVVLAGGVAEHFALMRPVIDEVLARHHRLVPTGFEVRQAETGDDAGAFGAAYAALRLAG
jgi:glucokinase